MDKKLRRIKHFFPNFPQTEKVLKNLQENILVLSVVPDFNKLLSWAIFLDCIDEVFEIYENLNNVAVIFQILEVLYGHFPCDPDVNFKLALQLTRNGKYHESFLYARKAFIAYRNDPRVCSIYSSICNKLVSRWHFPMLNDCYRNTAYKNAIARAARAGAGSIIDIGAGTGLLSMYSKQAGYTDVYACEQNKFMCEIATTIMEQNDSDVNVLPCNSLDLIVTETLPKRVSLAVTETFDCGLLGEGALNSIKHALENLILNPEDTGSVVQRVIPSNAEVFIAAAQSRYIAKQTKAVDSGYLNGRSLMLESDEPYMSENFRNMPNSFRLLSEWQPILNVDFNSLSSINDTIRGKKDVKINVDINIAGNLDCIVLAFKLRLDEEHCISTFPEETSCWENAIYPMFSSKLLRVGEQIPLNINFTDGITICLKECLSPSLFTRSVSDASMLKCINSPNYCNYWKHAADHVCQMIANRDSVTILDNCPFPVAGLTVKDYYKNAKLFTMDKEKMEAVNFLGHDINLAKEGDTFDVIFLWPFKKLGECHENIRLSRWRSWLKPGGILYPNTIEVSLYGIESPFLINASSVDDINTCGLEIAQVFNKFKTQVHYEIDPEALLHTTLTSEEIILTEEIESHKENLHETSFISESEGEHFLKTLHKLEKKTMNFKVYKAGNLCGFFRTNALYYTSPDGHSLDEQLSNDGAGQSEHTSSKNLYKFMNIAGDSTIDLSCHLLSEVVQVKEGDILNLKVAATCSDMCLYDLEKHSL